MSINSSVFMLNSSGFKTAAPYFFILLLAFAVYLPFCRQPLQDSDQMGYFWELKGSTRLADGLKLYDYNIVREFWKGDEILFRPLLMVWLGVQNHFFSYHHLPWNLSNLILFLINLALLYSILKKVGPPVYAFLFTLLFALSNAPRGLVLNPHLGAYMIAYGLLLAALLQLRELLDETPPFSGKKFFLSLFCFSAAGFINELMILYSLTAALLLNPVLKKKNVKGSLRILLLLPFVIYLFFYSQRDFSAAPRLFFSDGVDPASFLSQANGSQLPQNALYMLREMFRDVFPNLRWQKLALASVFFLIFSPKYLFRGSSVRIFLNLFLLSAVFIFILSLGVFRGTFMRNYYPYFFHLLLVVFLFNSIRFPSALETRRNACGFLLLLIMIGFNFFNRVVEAQGFLKNESESVAYFGELEKFVDTHRSQPGFSFSIPSRTSDIDPQYGVKKGYPDVNASEFSLYFSDVLFQPFLKSPALYALTWDSRSRQFLIHKNSFLEDYEN